VHAGTDRACGPAPARSVGGYTLVEILVVVVVVGIVAGAATLAIAGAGIERHAQREALRFGELVRLTRERAILTGRDHGLRTEDQGYVVMARGIPDWRMERDGDLRPRVLEQGLTLALSRDGRALPSTPAQADGPQVVCYASGELTPFTVHFGDGDRVLETVVGTLDGEVRVRSADSGPPLESP